MFSRYTDSENNDFSQKTVEMNNQISADLKRRSIENIANTPIWFWEIWQLLSLLQRRKDICVMINANGFWVTNHEAFEAFDFSNRAIVDYFGIIS